MVQDGSRVLFRFAAVVGLVVVASAAMTPPAPPVPGMTFRLRLTFRSTTTSGRAPRAVTMLGHGEFGGGKGRVDIDSLDSPSPFRKGDFIIMQDTLNSLWGHRRDTTVSRMNAPLVNPLEGISEKLSSGTGTPSELKVDFDTVSLDESINGIPARHFRITADASYPIGPREIGQKVVVEQWLAKIPVSIVNPFGSRIRGLPDLPATKGDYRNFLNTLAAANRVFGEAVTLKTVTTTSWTYGGGMGEDHYQTVELLDLKEADIDPSHFVMPPGYKMRRPAAADAVTTPPKKPPTGLR